MEIRNLYQPFELNFEEFNEYRAHQHKNTFFEMVFVLEGTGVQMINHHHLPYHSNKLFLIFPQDIHDFEVRTASKFFFIRFNDSYLNTQGKEWVQYLEYIFHNYNHLPGCILKNASDKPLVRALVEALIREHVNTQPKNRDVMKQLINTIVVIAARNIVLSKSVSTPKNNDEKVLPLLNYIHQHIYEPQQLKIEALAAYFHIAPSYMSEYFKIQVGQTFQEYVMTYKLKLVETRLCHTSLQINEIVSELGFTDASHLNRLFKKYKGITPSAFRKKLRIE